MHSNRPVFANYFIVTGALLALVTGATGRCYAAAGKGGGTSLKPVIVTASRYAQTADSALASVSIITRADIEREQPQDVLQALRSLPGVEIARSGGYGKLSSVFLRGAASNQVLVLVDGIRVGSATDGRAAWEFIPINQVEHIEVVRGPRSSLYGADAVGGVIQIFTRQGAWHGKQAEASATGGSNGTGAGNAAFGWGNGRTRGAIDVGLFHTDGIDSRTESGPYEESDRDGYANRNIGLSLSHRFRKRDLLSVNYLHAQGYNQYDPDPTFGGTDLDHFIQSVFSAKYSLAVTDNDSLRLKAGRSRIQRISRREDHGGQPTRFNTERPSVSLINALNFGRTTWLVGGDYRDDRLSSSTAYTQSSRYNRGVFTEITSRYLGIDGQVSGRFDDNQTYGDHFTGQVALGYDITHTYRVEASYGNAFQAPSFNVLFYPSASNPNLDPERSRSAELDFLGRYGWAVGG
jgi:vitamin B12 transporter